MGWVKNPKMVWGYSACDNPLCPNKPDKVKATYQNGSKTLCSTCLLDLWGGK